MCLRRRCVVDHTDSSLGSTEGCRAMHPDTRKSRSRRQAVPTSFGAHGRGRAPPGTVAQQRSRERGVAARLPMPEDGRSVRGDDVETRVRFPPARAGL